MTAEFSFSHIEPLSRKESFNMIPKTIDPSRSVLLVIDMQNAFVLPSSPLCVRMAADSVPALQKTIEEARSIGIRVIWICRKHAADGSDLEPFRRELLKEKNLLDIFSEGSDGIRIIEDFHPGNEQIVWKTRYSAFFGTGLADQLKSEGISTVLVSGTQTPNCVRATSVDALSHDFRSIVLADCTSSQTAEIQQANLSDMKAAGIETADSLSQLLQTE